MNKLTGSRWSALVLLPDRTHGMPPAAFLWINFQTWCLWKSFWSFGGWLCFYLKNNFNSSRKRFTAAFFRWNILVTFCWDILVTFCWDILVIFVETFWSLFVETFWSLFVETFWSLFVETFWSFFVETFWSLFIETFWSLKHFGRVSHSCIKTCSNSVH